MGTGGSAALSPSVKLVNNQQAYFTFLASLPLRFRSSAYGAGLLGVALSGLSVT